MSYEIKAIIVVIVALLVVVGIASLQFNNEKNFVNRKVMRGLDMIAEKDSAASVFIMQMKKDYYFEQSHRIKHARTPRPLAAVRNDTIAILSFPCLHKCSELSAGLTALHTVLLLQQDTLTSLRAMSELFRRIDNFHYQPVDSNEYVALYERLESKYAENDFAAVNYLRDLLLLPPDDLAALRIWNEY